MLLLLLLFSLPMARNDSGKYTTGLTLQPQQCHIHEEVFLTKELFHPLQGVTAKRLHLTWWCALLESLFLLLLVKLLQW
ncbi:uncharacterized protein LOC128254057 [Drosophila gunungcola]|uniref:Uncharacterized protein n=1 Tax=Drosophila gunungcola TaxID=103775 RepID=A0A9Q0BQ48_9MUSC|nr:uncharacterized protein LOC128254057 [Drosophila gunungcola]XP_052838812.1 uncharacterized protein LOC128254057 [Drosophila gunungcola]KAI8039785.1 hypothetical protein M5D96_007209 [Drosophila gunungcola]